jgi:hypothetical protein
MTVNGDGNAMDGEKVMVVQVAYHQDTGKIGVLGVTPGNKVVASWMLHRAALAIDGMVKPTDVAIALGEAEPAERHIIPVHGKLRPFDDHGIRGGGR